MRILFDSKKLMHKTPFGCLTPEDTCTMRIDIPTSVGTTAVKICLVNQDNTPYQEVAMSFLAQEGAYDFWQGQFTLPHRGLYFYYFLITGNTGTFRLFKQGNDTNMEAGDLWQVSCVPADFTTPKWAQGATIYQIFPDRFYKEGACDLTGKLTPYTVHEAWDEEVDWRPNEKGEILNNDFYGGNFRGITEKMDYIASLGTTVLYLNPISKSFSNHRYDTGDYKTPDPMLGTLEDFSQMCQAAHQRGIRVILDGVYSHTGANSLYFDKQGTFGGKGAYCTPDSPYYRWYQFKQYPDKYICWWDFDTLPTVNKLDESFMDYIFDSDDSVLAHWLKWGADGFRLDVADELPHEFILRLKKRLRQLRPDALLMGEVWEDASNKIAYGFRCRYFADGILDSVMNYPFRTAILKFLRRQDGGENFQNAVMTILENYPAQVIACNMNMLGTHDTPRILTALVDEFDGSREALARRRLTQEQKALALQRLTLATVLQYTLPGSPSTYYADEAGMEGAKDPFNRRTYPWGKENLALLNHFKALGQLRKDYFPLRCGSLEFFHAGGNRIGFCRSFEGKTLRIYVNQSDSPWEILAGNILYAGGLENGAIQSMGFAIVEDA